PGGGRSTVYRGADLRYNLEISLEQAAHGFETKIRIPGMALCDSCKGSGARPGSQPTTCPSCRGAGQVRVSQGPFSIAQTCPRCHGTGSIIPNPCAACAGTGRVKLQKTLSVRIPAGVDEGDRVRLSGEGEPGVNGRLPGDLFCHVVVETPVSLTERQRQLLREFESISQQDSALHNPRAKSWLDKVKEFFES